MLIERWKYFFVNRVHGLVHITTKWEVQGHTNNHQQFIDVILEMKRSGDLNIKSSLLLINAI
ncbi:MAG: hypothetical protein J0I84_15780 [Terrimonas sp.]|nr:hypothetical protein [Terrimonas sp.]OJY92174.1 MAG: hypothetical protein BGP13_08395 [Sphingobacteriales bacterium 40-81]